MHRLIPVSVQFASVLLGLISIIYSGVLVGRLMHLPQTSVGLDVFYMACACCITSLIFSLLSRTARCRKLAYMVSITACASWLYLGLSGMVVPAGY